MHALKTPHPWPAHSLGTAPPWCQEHETPPSYSAIEPSTGLDIATTAGKPKHAIKHSIYSQAWPGPASLGRVGCAQAWH